MTAMYRSSGRDGFRFARPILRAARFVLHAFQKKSKRGIVTPKVEMDLI